MRVAVRLLMLVAIVGPLMAGPSLRLSAHERPSTLAADVDLQPYAPADAARLYTYAPDGSLIAGAPELGPTALCTYAVPSGETVACADIDAAGIRMEITDISWSPDSRFLAFAERTLLTFQDGDLWTMDARTGALTNVTDDGYEGDLPLFDDDAVLDGPVYADVLPRWSPDSSRLAFSRTVLGDPDGLARSELWTVDLATGDDVRVATVAEDEIGALYFNLAWSPDSATIYASLFHRANDDPDNGIWAFDVASGTGQQLVGGSSEHFLGFAPAVLAASPRGDYLTIFYPQYIGQFQAEQGGYALFDLERGEVVELPVPDGYEVDTPVRLVLPGFSPDGASVIYGVHRFVDPPGAIALLDLDAGTVEVLADLPDGGFPIPASLGEGIRIAENGVAFVLTGIDTGLLIPVQPLQGAASTPATADTGIPGRVTVGHDGSELHAAPSHDAPTVLAVGPGHALDVIGAPVTNDEGTWLPVRDPETRTIGYILQDTLSE